ncbi:MAG: hypothetical protein H7235_00840, partial [Bdellovibrionaceae bacterium]|nr:hypothetical protein [Pseudobdellovibrionaceae bacterium]
MSNARATLFCHQLFSGKTTSPGLFLHQQNPNLHTNKNIEKIAIHTKNETGTSLVKPADKIMKWLDYMENSYKKANGNLNAI